MINLLFPTPFELPDQQPLIGEQSDSSDPLDDGMVAHWLFNDGAGNRLTDTSGYDNHGTLTNGPAWVAGRRGGALSFDGTDDHVLSANNIGLSGNLTATMSAWIYVTGTKSLQSIVAFGGNGAGTVMSLFLNINGADTGRLSSEFNGGNSVATADGAIQKNQWYHVAVTKVASTIPKIYITGVEQTVSGSFSIPNITDSQVYIGKYTDSEHRFQGLIDDVRIHNRALSAAEVAELYQRTLPQRRNTWVGCGVFEVPAVATGARRIVNGGLIHHSIHGGLAA